MGFKQWAWNKMKHSDKFTIFSILYTIFTVAILTAINLVEAEWKLSIIASADYWKTMTPFIIANFTLPLSYAMSTREKKRTSGKLKIAIEKNNDLFTEANLSYWEELQRAVELINLEEKTKTYLTYARKKFDTTKQKNKNEAKVDFWRKEKNYAYKFMKYLQADCKDNIVSIKELVDDEWDIENVSNCPSYEIMRPEDYFSTDNASYYKSKKFNFLHRITRELATSRVLSTLMFALWTSFNINNFVSLKDTSLNIAFQFILIFYGCYKIVGFVESVMDTEYLPYLIGHNGFLKRVMTKAGWKGLDSSENK